jgi:hypothetical protein
MAVVHYYVHAWLTVSEIAAGEMRSFVVPVSALSANSAFLLPPQKDKSKKPGESKNAIRSTLPEQDLAMTAAYKSRHNASC